LVTLLVLLPEVFVPPVPPLEPDTARATVVVPPVAAIVALAPLTEEVPPRLTTLPLARPVGLPPVALEVLLPVMPVEPVWLFETLMVVWFPVAEVFWLAPWVFWVTDALDVLVAVLVLVVLFVVVLVDEPCCFFFHSSYFELTLVRSGALMTVTGKINAVSRANPRRPTTVLRRTHPEVLAPELLDID
jgi:hypothetical protein